MGSIKKVISIDSGTVKCGRLASESAKLDPAFEKTLAEEGLGHELAAPPEEIAQVVEELNEIIGI